MLFLCGCGGAESNATEVEINSAASIAPEHADVTPETPEYEMKPRTLYYPEGSGEGNAEYILSYELPFFYGRTAESANAAILLWENELLERVNSERLPFADRAENEKAPSTLVKAEISFVRGYTNVILTETADYGAEPEISKSAIVLKPNGEETNLYEATGLYTPEELISQQIYNYIDKTDPAREKFHGDITLSDIELSLDLYNGFYLKENAYELLFQGGMLADESQGAVSIEIAEAALYPDFVGEMISPEDYSALLPALQRLARACAAENHSFDLEPDALTATLFMALLFSNDSPNGTAISISREEYERQAKVWFSSWPQDISSGDGTVLENGEYRIPMISVADYGLRLDECGQEGDTLLLRGVLFYGKPGSADWGELTPVTLKLTKGDAAASYYLTGFDYA